MTIVSIRDARKNFSALVNAASRGEIVTITRNGLIVAQLSPPPSGRTSFPDLTTFRATVKVTGKPISQTVRDLRDQERY